MQVGLGAFGRTGKATELTAGWELRAASFCCVTCDWFLPPDPPLRTSPVQLHWARPTMRSRVQSCELDSRSVPVRWGHKGMV